MKYWMDANHSGVLYYGDDSVRQWIADNGGYPQEFRHPFVESNGMAMICIAGGEVESWDIVVPRIELITS